MGILQQAMNIIVELPFWNPNVGGVTESVKLAQRLGAHVRFQTNHDFKPLLSVPYTFGLPDKHFPKCDVVITYSDNPYLKQLVALPQVGRVLIYMLSYGMAIDRERANVSNPNVTVMCSTQKIEKAILKDGFDVTRVGFALDMDDMMDANLKERTDTCAIYYHPMKSKRYPLAVEVADSLFGSNFTEGTYSFGTSEGYELAKKPIGLINHMSNANRVGVAWTFNRAKVFVSASNSEGLNLTPIEATLCGCPSVVCDGAIGELFIDGKTCFIPETDGYFDIYNSAIEILADYPLYSAMFKKNMQDIVKQYTWDNVIKNITALL